MVVNLTCFLARGRTPASSERNATGDSRCQHAEIQWKLGITHRFGSASDAAMNAVQIGACGSECEVFFGAGWDWHHDLAAGKTASVTDRLTLASRRRREGRDQADRGRLKWPDAEAERRCEM